MEKQEYPPDDLTVFLQKYPDCNYPDEVWVKIAERQVKMSNENKIHPTAIIGEFVKMGKGNVIGANSIITGQTTIGDNNKISAFSVIGTEPEHRDFWDAKVNKGVMIGNRCVIREFTTINAGCENPTIIEDDVTMLRGSHVGHDSRIMRNATLSCNVLIGGHSLVGIFVNMGLGSVCHQYSRIPHYCMIGMNSTITKSFSKNAKAFEKHVGSPAEYLAVNTKFTEHFSFEDICRIKREFDDEKL